MRFFKKLARYNVCLLQEQLALHPELWDEHRFRTELGPDAPFSRTSDIWLRWRALAELTEPKHYNEPHFAVFWPAWHTLPALHPIVFDLMHRVHATHLGAILITRVPAGERVKPHSDKGGWNAEMMDTKVYVPIQTNDRCETYCEDERIVMQEGDAWRFDNLVTHGLDNHGAEDRISAVITMRTK